MLSHSKPGFRSLLGCGVDVFSRRHFLLRMLMIKPGQIRCHRRFVAGWPVADRSPPESRRPGPAGGGGSVPIQPHIKGLQERWGGGGGGNWGVVKKKGSFFFSFHYPLNVAVD